MVIIHLTSNLMAGSSLSVEARKHSVKVKQVANVAAVSKWLQENSSPLLIVDLQSDNLDLNVLVELTADKSMEVIGYAQHVREELLQHAADCGIPEILTRGQFTHAIPEIVQRVLS